MKSHFQEIVDDYAAAETENERQVCRDAIVATFDVTGTRPPGVTDAQLVMSVLRHHGYYMDPRAAQIGDAAGSLFMALTYAGEDGLGSGDRHVKSKAKLAKNIADNPFAAMIHGIVEDELRKHGVGGQK